MSNIESKDNSKGSGSEHSSGGLFESGLSRARRLIDKGDLDQALELLLGLEAKYVNAVSLFDLLGEALLARGSVKEGIRYKTLHEVLRGTFQIVIDEGSRDALADSGLRPSLFDEGIMAGEMDLAIDDFAPVTPAMGQEFVRQGHYGQAMRVFDKLIARNPADVSLREARDIAQKKDSEKKLLGVFQRWLKNIEQMKSDETAIS
jgi:tetratricopeptide (TPR) repeat protein